MIPCAFACCARVRNDVGASQFAAAVAHAHHRREVLVDRILERFEHILRIDIDDGRVARYGSRPFEVEIGFYLIGLVRSRVGPERDHLRIFRGQVELGAESPEVRETHIGLSRDHQFLPGSVEPGVIERLNVIDRRQIAGAEVMGRRSKH